MNGNDRNRGERVKKEAGRIGVCTRLEQCTNYMIETSETLGEETLVGQRRGRERRGVKACFAVLVGEILWSASCPGPPSFFSF